MFPFSINLSHSLSLLYFVTLPLIVPLLYLSQQSSLHFRMLVFVFPWSKFADDTIEPLYCVLFICYLVTLPLKLSPLNMIKAGSEDRKQRKSTLKVMWRKSLALEMQRRQEHIMGRDQRTVKCSTENKLNIFCMKLQLSQPHIHSGEEKIHTKSPSPDKRSSQAKVRFKDKHVRVCPFLMKKLCFHGLLFSF